MISDSTSCGCVVALEALYIHIYINRQHKEYDHTTSWQVPTYSYKLRELVRVSFNLFDLQNILIFAINLRNIMYEYCTVLYSVLYCSKLVSLLIFYS